MSDKKKMGLFSCVALIAGASIGSAIFSISGLTIHYAGASAVISWIIAALIFGFYGMVVTALACRYPNSGGIFVFPKRAIGGRAGSITGFFSGWGYLVSNIIAIAFSAICMGKYLSLGFSLDISESVFSVAGCIVAALTIVFGGKWSQRIQNSLVVTLILMLLLFCGVSLFGGNFDFPSPDHFFNSGSKGTGGFLAAIPLALVAYGGCVAIAFLASEVDEPEKTIPRSLAIGLSIVAVLYAVIMVALVGTLPADILSADEENCYVPFFASVTASGNYLWMIKAVAICGTVVFLTNIIALTRVNARAVEAIASSGLLPGFLAVENRNGEASSAVVLTTLIAAILCCKPSLVENYINLGALLNIVSISLTCVSLLFVEGKTKVLPLVTTVLLWICYIPEIIHSGSELWVFSAVIYLAGMSVFLIFFRKSSQTVSGIVVRGKGHGHRHSMPTANLQLFEGEKYPSSGVWETRVLVGGKKYKGLTNFGLRPSDDDSTIPTLETVILDFKGDIYGQTMYLQFVRYIRPIMKFENLDALKKQIDLDRSTISQKQ